MNMLDDLIEFLEILGNGGAPDKWPDCANALKVIKEMQWKPIETYDKKREWRGRQALLSHKDHKWIRFGRFYPQVNAWYYSGTNERSQYSSVRGDEPTHWMKMPELPKD